MKKVAILMGSDSDLPVMQKAIDALDELCVPYTVRIMSAHRTPEACAQFVKAAKGEGYAAIIAAAGKAAHLAGAVAANTLLPVIGVPVKSSALEGLDALLSTVQMPAGIPVATVAIDGAKNAALIAAQIIATSDSELYARLEKQREDAKAAVLAKDKEISQRYGA